MRCHMVIKTKTILILKNFMNGLKKSEIEIDRRVLADLALHEPEAFTALANKAKEALAAAA